jgi:hypothetical protein
VRRTSLVYLLGLAFPLCARAADSDGDGLEDADEVLAHLPPTVADSDGDGLFDHLDPDMDGDGVVNVDECRLGGVSGLALVNDYIETVNETYQELKSAGKLSMGLDDYLMALVSKLESHVYLLKQRVRSTLG